MKDAGWVEGRNLEIKIVSIIGSGKTPSILRRMPLPYRRTL
jgi:hypothetical protein